MTGKFDERRTQLLVLTFGSSIDLIEHWSQCRKRRRHSLNTVHLALKSVSCIGRRHSFLSICILTSPYSFWSRFLSPHTLWTNEDCGYSSNLAVHSIISFASLDRECSTLLSSHRNYGSNSIIWQMQLRFRRIGIQRWRLFFPICLRAFSVRIDNWIWTCSLQNPCDASGVSELVPVTVESYDRYDRHRSLGKVRSS